MQAADSSAASILCVTDRVTIPDGTMLYATVRATLARGLQASSTSDGVLYDTSPPSLAFLGLGTRPGQHSSNIPAGSPVAVNFNCSDAHSSVSFIEVTVGPSYTDQSLVSARLNDTDKLNNGVVYTSLLAVTGSAYVGRVTCINKAGLSTVRYTPFAYADDTPPVVRSPFPGSAQLTVASFESRLSK